MGTITSYSDLAVPSPGDKVPVVDLSDVSMAASGTNKDTTAEGLAKVLAVYSFELCAETADMATGDGLAGFLVPAEMNGMNLVRASFVVRTAGSGGVSEVQIRRVRDTTAVDMLSTKLTIDSTELKSADSSTAYVINTSNDDVQTDDRIYVDGDTVPATKPKGAMVTLGFAQP